MWLFTILVLAPGQKTLIEDGSFYPPQLKNPAERLNFYAQHFNTVEVDSTFYAFPAERNARLWVERTPSSFLFNIKSFSLFTFHKTSLSVIPQFLKEELPERLQNDLTSIYRKSLKSG